MRRTVVAMVMAVVMAVAVLAGCSSGSGSGAGAAGSDPFKAWCGLTIGQSRADVLAAMGAPHGDKAAAFRSAGVDMAEWDEGESVLLSTFEGGKAANLQAYAGQVGPVGSGEIDCEPFRHST